MTDAQQTILEHVALYRLTTIDAVFALFYQEEEGTRRAARASLARLVDAELLIRFEIRNRSFYQLSKTGCAALGVPKEAAQPFPTQTLIERYSMLCFCSLGRRKRVRLTQPGLFTKYPELAGEQGIDPTKQHYYLDHYQGVERLGRVTVDSGSEVKGLLVKCREIVDEAKTGLQPLIENKLFVLTILTPFETKREKLLEAITNKPLGVLTRVEVQPEIKHVIVL